MSRHLDSWEVGEGLFVGGDEESVGGHGGDRDDGDDGEGLFVGGDEESVGGHGGDGEDQVVGAPWSTLGSDGGEQDGVGASRIWMSAEATESVE